MAKIDLKNIQKKPTHFFSFKKTRRVKKKKWKLSHTIFNFRAIMHTQIVIVSLKHWGAFGITIVRK